jgi:hypothetical protein
MKEFFNAIVFKNGHMTIRRREVVAMILIIILLFFGLKSCATKSEHLERLEMLEDECSFPRDNINRLFDLLERSDLCENAWFLDFDDYITRISNQNEDLVDMKSEKHQDIYDIQVKLLDAMENFRDEQSEENLTELQEVVTDYDDLYRNICKGEIGK